jgi:O-antigen biosynthesis protein
MPATPEQYRRLYLEPLVAAQDAKVVAPPQPLSARHWYRQRERKPRITRVDQLFDLGVRCGHGESLEALAARAATIDGELERTLVENAAVRQSATQLERELTSFARAHTRHVANLELAVEAARAHARVYEESTFWRITEPLRWVVHRMKLSARLARRVGHGIRLLPTRVATARHIVRDAGPMELARRVRRKLFAPAALQAALRPRGGLEPAIHELVVPTSDQPRISVIIPTYGQDLHTFTCLKALAAEAARVPLEVIVMDDCGPTVAAEALAAVDGVRFERNATNLGFVGNCNRGASFARGEYLLFLNNDAVLQPGSMEALLRVFEGRKSVGVVGAKLVYPDGRLQEAGGIVWRDGSAWNYGRGDDPAKPEYNYVREADYCSGACFLVPRALFAQLGGFDPAYAPAYCEDVDFCFKVRKAGLHVYYQSAAEVVHFEGVSHGTDESQGTKRYQVVNRERLYERWKSELGAHRVNGMAPRMERDRGAARRALIVEACMLTPDQDAGSVRTWRLIDILRAMGCKVTLAADNLEHLEPHVSRLREEGVEVLHLPFTTSIEGYLEAHGSEFDMVVLARYYVASRHIASVRRYAPDALLVFDTIDLHYLRARRLADLDGGRALAQSAEAIYREEIQCVRGADVTWVVSPVEKEALAREVPQANVIVLATIHDTGADCPPFAEREGILFVGGYRHPPNIDAALHYTREILPRVHALLPSATTYLVGSNAPPAVSTLAAPGLEFVGYVPDIEPWLARCRVSIAPIRYGAGVKGKVSESMSHGLPVVASTVAVEGMHFVDGYDVLVADDPQAFADAVARLYRDEALWKRVSSTGMASIQRHFSPEAAEAALRATFEAGGVSFPANRRV